jgi:DNA primase
MGEDVERIKQRIPLPEYLQRYDWTAQRSGPRQEFVGLCPFHRDTRPSFYVNAGKNLFHCHGCGRGGDLIRLVELLFDLPFRQSVAHLEQELALSTSPAELLEQAVAFFQSQLHRHSEANRVL